MKIGIDVATSGKNEQYSEQGCLIATYVITTHLPKPIRFDNIELRINEFAYYVTKENIFPSNHLSNLNNVNFIFCLPFIFM